jgi:dsRNA-specific ribonuclease
VKCDSAFARFESKENASVSQFECEVWLGSQFLGKGCGSTKMKAKTAASENALSHFFDS